MTHAITNQTSLYANTKYTKLWCIYLSSYLDNCRSTHIFITLSVESRVCLKAQLVERTHGIYRLNGAF